MPRPLAEGAPILPRLHRINALEAKMVAWEMPDYLSQGIHLRRGATVLDVGANIGAFSAQVFDRLSGDVRLFALEPGPPIFAVLQRNARELFAGRLTVLPYGASAREHETAFVFYPAITTISSTVPTGGIGTGAPLDRERVVRGLAEMLDDNPVAWASRWTPGPLRTWAATLLMQMIRRRMRRSITYRVRLRPLSAVIDEYAIETIDLLKIDVERAELDVLAGIHDRHWPRIRQAVIEVEHWTTRHPQVVDLLTAHGFHTSTRQRPIDAALNTGLVFAARPSTATR
jgi:FkbM family methyltransferase